MASSLIIFTIFMTHTKACNYKNGLMVRNINFFQKNVDMFYIIYYNVYAVKKLN